MPVIAIMYIRNSFNPGSKSFTHHGFTGKSLSPGFRIPGKIKSTIIREKSHDLIQIMPAEGVKELFQCFFSNNHIPGLAVEYFTSAIPPMQLQQLITKGKYFPVKVKK